MLGAGQLLFLPIVVVHLDAEHNGARHGGDDIGDEQRPVFKHQALDGKQDTAYTHHQEGGQCDAVGVMGTDGVDSLRHVAKYQTDRTGVTDNVGQVVGDKIDHMRYKIKNVGPQRGPT